MDVTDAGNAAYYWQVTVKKLFGLELSTSDVIEPLV